MTLPGTPLPDGSPPFRKLSMPTYQMHACHAMIKLGVIGGVLVHGADSIRSEPAFRPAALAAGNVRPELRAFHREAMRREIS